MLPAELVAVPLRALQLSAHIDTVRICALAQRKRSGTLGPDDIEKCRAAMRRSHTGRQAIIALAHDVVNRYNTLRSCPPNELPFASIGGPTPVHRQRPEIPAGLAEFAVDQLSAFWRAYRDHMSGSEDPQNPYHALFTLYHENADHSDFLLRNILTPAQQTAYNDALTLVGSPIATLSQFSRINSVVTAYNFLRRGVETYCVDKQTLDRAMYVHALFGRVPDVTNLLDRLANSPSQANDWLCVHQAVYRGIKFYSTQFCRYDGTLRRFGTIQLACPVCKYLSEICTYLHSVDVKTTLRCGRCCQLVNQDHNIYIYSTGGDKYKFCCSECQSDESQHVRLIW